MQALLILTFALIAAAILTVVLTRLGRKTPPEISSAPPPRQPEPFTVYSVAMFTAVAAVVTAALIPMVAIFHTAKEPALIALLVFFLLPILAYAFLARCHYLPREQPTLKPPPRKPARK